MTDSDKQLRYYLAFWLILVVYATWSHLEFGNFDARIALKGWSVYDFTNSILFPKNFLRDYPGGSWTSGHSTLPWIYPALASIGIPVSVTLPVLMALEITVLTFGAFFLLRTLFKNIHPVTLIALTCLLALSHIRYSNLARFGNPFFHGQFYGYADGLRLFAIAYYIRGRHTLSSFNLIAGFAIHPIKALFGFAFIAGMQLWNWKKIFSTEIITPYFMFIVFSGLWAYYWIGFGQDLGIPKMTSEEFFKYTPLFHSHWFPQDLNIFTEQHLPYATAFVSSLLVGISSLVRCNLKPDIKIQLLLGITAVCLLAIIGITVAWQEISPALVKICLQRGTVLVLSIITIITLGQWLTDIKNGRWWYVFLLTTLLISSFYSIETWPVLISIIYAISTLTSERSDDPSIKFLKAIILSLGITIIAYEYYLYTQDMQNKKYWAFQLILLITITAASIGYKTLNRELRVQLETYLDKYSSHIIILIFTSSAVVWSIDNKKLSDEYIKKGVAYKDVQLWARDNTSTDALFMTDPLIRYGWRDYSQRSSFGSLKEWYKTGWLYTGSQKALHDGLERAERLGVQKLVPERSEKRPRSEFIAKAYERASLSFYKPDGNILAGITSDFDIQYIVMDNNKARKSGAIPTWEVAFENAYYTVLVPPHIYTIKQPD